MNLYQRDDGTLISVSSDGIHISYDMMPSNSIAPLPPFPVNRTQEGKEETTYLHHHLERTSDVALDRASGDILYAFFDKGFTDITCCSSCSDKNRGPRVYVYFYHQATQTWITNILPVERLDSLSLSFQAIRLYWRKDQFYIGLWRYPNTVTIFHGTLADVKKGGTLPISSTEPRPLGENTHQ